MSAALAEAGLFVEGLRCAGCAYRVERELAAAPGVAEARVSYATGRALVSFAPDATDAEALARRVEDLGYRALPYDPAALERPATQERRRALVRVLVAGFLAGNVMILSLALYLGSLQGIEPDVRRALRWLAIALSLPAVTWCAAPFWRGALGGLRRGELTIDVPVVLGVGTAFGVSIAGTWAEVPHLFIDSAAVIVFLILLGRTLEGAARARSRGAVERLLASVPETALVKGPDGVESVPVSSLAAGDRVVLPPGARVPADGEIVRGASELDEALLTGESLPVARRAGERVAAGTRNLLAELELRIVAPAAEGTVARLAALLERAQAERPAIQLLADRIASVFAPAVLTAAAAVALFWLWRGAPALDIALTAAAVLIVACPCALALATPAALSAAIGRAARFGILWKSADALERSAAARRVVLDKTGTLTEGELEVVAVEPAPDVARSDLLATAAWVEGASTHPVAEAIRRVAGEPVREPPAERRVRPGLGVVADGACVGAPALLVEGELVAPTELLEKAQKYARGGASLAWVASGGRVLGFVALADTPRADAARAVARLHALGLGVHLVTGDHELAARRAAQEAGISELSFDARPEDKVEIVKRERARHGGVVVAGDGLNDAAALAAGDVGFALARGADVTVDAADAVLVPGQTGGLAALPAALSLARTTLARVRESLAFALAYNALAVPLAAAGWLHPLVAAAAMSVSSLVVTGNALRLLRWEPPE